MKTQLKVLFVTISAAAMLALGALLPTAAVSADDTQPTKIPWRQTMEPLKATLQALPTHDPANLSNVLKREQLALSNQSVRLDVADQVAETTQAYIDEQKGQGKDTASLETALATYKTELQTARGFHDEAESTLSSPAGFDASGNVTDKETARQTVHTAGQSLRQVHTHLTTASLTLRTAVKEYRAANKAK
jgi:hypothetical protein